ncbi:MAG: radical SAM protein [Chloroflexi bacterium RBG_16_57_11]|nr:MAG: radical SAM protein [Chloroflexi bacterium RBG_16_57_11]
MVGRAFEPAYLSLLHTGELIRRAEQAYERLSRCDFCAWECKVDRRAGALGVCRSGERARLSSYGPHRGEEDLLRGWRGSGTIFFAQCNLRCQYCQNYDISQMDAGEPVKPEILATVMLDLQDSGCHNINFVSPTHVVAPILAAVLIAAKAGLRLPLVYNTGGYDSLSALSLLDGVIDIYMPDMKYASAGSAWAYSKARRYPQANQAAVKEMHRQVGDLIVDQHGLAQRGLLVRHLVLPNGLAGTKEIVRFLAEEISPDTYLNLMDQYRPEHNVRRYRNQFPKLNRPITRAEYNEAVSLAREAGLHRLDRRGVLPIGW